MSFENLGSAEFYIRKSNKTNLNKFSTYTRKFFDKAVHTTKNIEPRTQYKIGDILSWTSGPSALVAALPFIFTDYYLIPSFVIGFSQFALGLKLMYSAEKKIESEFRIKVSLI